MITGSYLGDVLLWIMVAIVLFSFYITVFGDHGPPRPPYQPD